MVWKTSLQGDFPMKIGIFTAMEKEASSFLAQATSKTQVGQFTVYQIPLGKHQAYLICPPSVGQICASAACQILITQYQVDIICNLGVVGALTESTSLLSTVYVDSVVHYEMDTSQIDNVPQGRYLCFDDVAIPTDSKLLQIMQSIQPYPTVRCASGDKFVADSAQKHALSTQFNAQICDMESAAIAIVCKVNNVPCLMVKCISDSLFGGAGEYVENSQKATQGFFQFVLKLADALN